MSADGGERQARKGRSEAILREEGIPFIAHLPLIAGKAEALRRPAAEVADRLQGLVLIAALAEGVDKAIIDKVLDDRGLFSKLSPKELAYLDDPDDEHQTIQFVWRYEAAWVLFWALRLSKTLLGLPRAICDVPLLAATVRDGGDLAARDLRPTADLLDATDLIFRCHWAVRQAGLTGQEAPAGLIPGVTMERHYALNWLVGYDEGVGWDGVPTHT